MLNNNSHYIHFSIDEHSFAFAVDRIKQIIRAVEFSKNRNSNHLVLGYINYHGDLKPVLNLRAQFNFPNREIRESDRCLLVESDFGDFFIVVDSVHEIVNIKDTPLKTFQIPSISSNKLGIEKAYFLQTKDKVILISDFEKLFREQDKEEISKIIKEDNDQ